MSRKFRKKKDRLLIQKRMEAPPTYSEMEAQAEPEPELEPEIASVTVKTMTIDTILGQLASIKDHAQSLIHTRWSRMMISGWTISPPSKRQPRFSPPCRTKEYRTPER